MFAIQQKVEKMMYKVVIKKILCKVFFDKTNEQ